MPDGRETYWLVIRAAFNTELVKLESSVSHLRRMAEGFWLVIPA
jgi:hypothetical protein